MTKCNKNFFQNLALSLFILLPLLELYRAFFGGRFSLFVFSVEEIPPLLIGCVLLFAGLFFAVKEGRKKEALAVLLYFAVGAVYLFLHSAHVLSFKEGIYNEAEPNFFVECYYLLRMYFIPIGAGFSMFLLKVPRDRILRAIRCGVAILSGIIVVTDLLGVSFTAYHDGNKTVLGGFFSWFSLPENTDFADYTAKGLFNSANDLSSLFFATAPLLAWDTFRSEKRFALHFALLFCQMTAMVMIGTKIASIGFILGLCAAGAVLAAGYLSRKEKKKIRALLPRACAYALLCAVWAVLLTVSPGWKMQQNNRSVLEGEHRQTESVGDISDVLERVQAPEEKEVPLTPEELEKLEKYLNEKAYDHYIDSYFLDRYPVEGDVQFWSMVLSRDNTLNQDNRSFKLDIINRIIERNANPGDVVFGIGYTSHVPNAEKDFYFQKDLFGIAGLVVLLFPFFVPFIAGVFFGLKNLFTRKEFEWLALLSISLGAYFATAYFAGHVFDTLQNTYFLSGIAGCLAGVLLQSKTGEETP